MLVRDIKKVVNGRISNYDSDLEESDIRTLSQLPYPVFAMCPPIYIDAKEAIGKGSVNYEKYIGEWGNLYKILSFEAIILLIPPKEGLSLQTYMKTFVYLPHLDNVIILSNFGNWNKFLGEEIVAGDILIENGYKVINAPFRFNGYNNLKHLKGNIYFGGINQFVDNRIYDWLEKTYGLKIIRIALNAQSLSNNLFVLDIENVMMNASLPEVKEVKKIVNVIPVQADMCSIGICNNIRVTTSMINASSLQSMEAHDAGYNAELKKNNMLIDICKKLNYDITFLQIGEAQKHGMFGCCDFITPLNVGFSK
jgi:hypothetical protein